MSFCDVSVTYFESLLLLYSHGKQKVVEIGAKSDNPDRVLETDIIFIFSNFL